MAKAYIDRAVGVRELRTLCHLARTEEQEFFRRNEHLVPLYRERLLAITLCQGAALQYLGQGYGVNDFDVHYFYSQNRKKPRLSRSVKRVWTSVGAFEHVAVDFIRTVIPSGVRGSNPFDTIQVFLREQPTPNARHLASKAVIGVFPRRLFRVVIWPEHSDAVR
jgi:hypothetical protein